MGKPHCTPWLSKSRVSPSEPTNTRLTKAFSSRQRRWPCHQGSSWCRGTSLPQGIRVQRLTASSAGRARPTHWGLPGCMSLPEMATGGEPAHLHTSHKMTAKWHILPKKKSPPNWFVLVAWTGVVIHCKMHSGSFLLCPVP